MPKTTTKAPALRHRSPTSRIAIKRTYDKPSAADGLRIKGRKATLLTATRELDLSHARVLREMLETP